MLTLDDINFATVMDLCGKGQKVQSLGKCDKVSCLTFMFDYTLIIFVVAEGHIAITTEDEDVETGQNRADGYQPLPGDLVCYVPP